MKRTMTAFCLAAAASWVVTVGAQSGTQTGSGSQSGSGTQSGTHMKHSDKSGSKLTVTGCLVADPSGNGYRLTNVSMDKAGEGTSGSMSGSGSGTETGSGTQSGSATGSQTGTSGSMSSDMSNTVELVAGKSVNLKSHVGERVEVTGTAMGKDKDRSPKGTSGEGSESMGSMGSGTESQSGSATGSQTGSGSSMSNGQSSMSGAHRLRVDSIRTVAGSCSAQ